jgi:hypothetical protein
MTTTYTPHLSEEALDALRSALGADAVLTGDEDLCTFRDPFGSGVRPVQLRNHAYRRFVETLKDAVDPNGILSPGKQEIWPRSRREPPRTASGSAPRPPVAASRRPEAAH